MPGMGGVNKNRNFILNCEGWKNLTLGPYDGADAVVRLAPMTGAVENVGYPDEHDFYAELVSFCIESGIPVTLGDGVPDEKLLWGIEAVKKHAGLKAGVFFKPYPDEKITERFLWAQNIAEFCGIDIDSYNIVTMRNLVHLEKKSAEQLLKLKKLFAEKNIPFALKGIFSDEDIELVKKIHPDIAVVSNHGGRVDVREGSTAEFLLESYKELLSNCGELWVDGGIRCASDVLKAASYGVKSVLVGRPFASALCLKKSFESIIK